MLLALVGLSSVALGAAAGGSGAGATLRVFSNSAWSGTPASSTTVPSLSFTGALVPGSSVELLATLQLPLTGEYNFSCAFANTTAGFLWIDDHLVCQDGKVYTTVPVARTDLPLKRLSKPSLPMVLRFVVPQPTLPRGQVSFLGTWNDGNNGTAGPRMLRSGPQSYGFAPQRCADACDKYEYSALQDVGGRFARKACPGAAPGSCTNVTGYCSCDNDFSRITSQGKPAAARCDHPVQTCSYVNSVYKSAPAPPPLPPGQGSREVAVKIKWQQLTAPASYGGVGTPVGPPMQPLTAATLADSAAPTLTPGLPALEVQRRAMQSQLATGWATWVFSDMLALASLPSGATVRPVICSLSKGTCLDQLIVNAGAEKPAANVRVGSHAVTQVQPITHTLLSQASHSLVSAATAN